MVFLINNGWKLERGLSDDYHDNNNELGILVNLFSRIFEPLTALI